MKIIYCAKRHGKQHLPTIITVQRDVSAKFSSIAYVSVQTESWKKPAKLSNEKMHKLQLFLSFSYMNICCKNMLGALQAESLRLYIPGSADHYVERTIEYMDGLSVAVCKSAKVDLKAHRAVLVAGKASIYGRFRYGRNENENFFGRCTDSSTAPKW